MGPCSTLLLWGLFHAFLTPTGGKLGLQQEGGLVSVALGANVTLRCFPNSNVVMHFSWYRQSLGGPPRLLSTVYKHAPAAVDRLRKWPRFEVRQGDKGLNHLHISDVRCNDSAVYYCGSAHSNVVEFGDGVFLHVRASEDNPQQFLNVDQGAHRFWCDFNCRTGHTNVNDSCHREDLPKKRSPTESVADGQDCGHGGSTEKMAAEIRILVLLSIGRIAILLLWVVIALLFCTVKSFS